MTKTNKILAGLVGSLILILVGLMILSQFAGKDKMSTYHAVFLRTGDLYFGQLVRFPHFGLKNVYLLSVNSQNQQNPISVQKFSNVFWGPEDFLRLNRDEVVWISKLDPAGQLAELIRTNPNLTAPPQDQQIQQFQAPQQPSVESSQ